LKYKTINEEEGNAENEKTIKTNKIENESDILKCKSKAIPVTGHEGP
jgi:hypothetical protein